MEIARVTHANENIYLRLIQAYEAEFSRITKKTPNQQGLFELDTILGDTVTGFLAYINQAPAGLAAISEATPSNFEMCEFYVLPCFRNQAMGTRFAHSIWSMFPGRWQIKQIEGANYASDFWRKAIARFQHGSFTEDRYHDPYWGFVTRQSFTIKPTIESTIEPVQHG
ncbi:MAG: hypothetical protein VKI42_08375 [Synechococcaceae cyanobacterium]|nr:hypothetical protein [Synechococcaceae cyanobacterium]